MKSDLERVRSPAEARDVVVVRYSSRPPLELSCPATFQLMSESESTIAQAHIPCPIHNNSPVKTSYRETHLGLDKIIVR
jgi:hypothetical protein